MANWLDDPAIKALLPHSKLIEEAFGLTEVDTETLAAFDRKDWSARLQSPRALACNPHERSLARAIADRTQCGPRSREPFRLLLCLQPLRRSVSGRRSWLDKARRWRRKQGVPAHHPLGWSV